MSKRYLSILSLILCAIICLSLAACSSNSAPASSNTNTETTGTAGADARTARPAGVPADYPNKNIEICHGFPAGSMTEAYVRLIMGDVAKKENWKNNFYIGFHEGASGQIGWTYTAEAAGDGYTIGIAQGTAMILPVSRGEQAWGLDKFSYICNMMTSPGAIAVVPDSPYQDLKDLVEAALAAPGQISIVVGGLTSSDGLAVTMVEQASGCQFNVVPTGDQEAAAQVMGGFVDAAWQNVDDFTSYVDAGELKIIATGATERSPFAPDAKTYQECGYDVIQANMRYLCGPASLDESIRQYLEDCFIASMNDSEVIASAENLNVPYDIKTGAETYQALSDFTARLQGLWNAAPWE